MFIKILTAFILSVTISNCVLSQIITVDPPFPTADEPATIYFNAVGTELEGYSGDVYAHTGVTIDGNDWQYVIAGWTENTEKAKLTRIEDDLYTLDLAPTVREYYEVPASEQITQLCLVFRSSDTELQTRPDIFYDVYQPVLAVIITLPEEQPLIVQIDDTIHVEWSTNLADSSFLYIDDEEVFADTGSSFQFDIPVTTIGARWVKAKAKNTTEMVADSFYYYVRSEPIIEDLPDGIRDGINYVNDTTVVLCLFAPEKEFVFAWGDHSNWELSEDIYMKRTPDGDRYWIEITGLEPQMQYIFQYFIDGDPAQLVGDMYCEQVSDPWNDPYISPETYPDLPDYPYDKTVFIASVFQTAQDEYQWQVENFNPPKKDDLVIYELLIRDFVETHDYSTLIDTLDYLDRLGVNAIELMPFNEFEGNSSWGYNPNYYFAPDKYYGPRNTLKAFIDECHSRGIAVFMDMVLNHSYGSPFVQMYYDQEQNRPAANSPWYNQESNFPYADANWGYDFNHESLATQALVDSINSYWMSEYKIDGFRFDFTKGFSNTIHGPNDPWGSNYDADRVRLLKRMVDEIWYRNPNAFVIFEHLAENSEEKVLADYGIMMWGNMNSTYNEATMGYNENGKSDFSWISYQKRNWNEPNVVGYMESHDEERLMYKNLTYGNSSGDYDITDLNTALKRQALAANFFFTIPGPKMIWQFGERGYDYTINYNPWDPDANDCRLCEKPPRWDYMDNWHRRNLWYTYASLIDLKKNFDVFETTDFELDVRWAVKKIKLASPDMSVVVLGNFHTGPAEIEPEFYFTGTWYDYWTGDSLEVNDVNEKIMLQAGEYRLYTSKKLTTPAFVGIEDHETSAVPFKIHIYPNPATSELHILLSSDSENKRVDIELLDLTGAWIKKIESTVVSRGLYQVQTNISGLKPGVYLLKVEIEGRSKVEKLIIQ